MDNLGKNLMKELMEKATAEAKKRIELKLKTLQSEIRKEGAKVRIIPGTKKDELFKISIEGASDELKDKISKALK